MTDDELSQRLYKARQACSTARQRVRDAELALNAEKANLAQAIKDTEAVQTEYNDRLRKQATEAHNNL